MTKNNKFMCGFAKSHTSTYQHKSRNHSVFLGFQSLKKASANRNIISYVLFKIRVSLM